VNSIYAVYAAPVMFEQNAGDVPALVRVTDYTWAALAHQNLNSFCGVGFPISNYSLPLSLAHEMGCAAPPAWLASLPACLLAPAAWPGRGLAAGRGRAAGRSAGAAAPAAAAWPRAGRLRQALLRRAAC
jgi:hypothetical protein